MSAPPGEPPASASPVFTGAAIDRADRVRKDPGRVRALLRDPATSVVAATADGVVLAGSGDPALLRRRVDGDGPRLDPDGAILLGLEPDGAVFAADLGGADAPASEAFLAGASVVSLRDAGAVLSREESGLAAYLVALLNWHRRHRHCANCGAPTEIADAGLSRHCPRCDASHFPRTDPVVIMLVEHHDRLLLGRRSGWPANRYSVLAGFVSPGETPEEAVVREVREESGITARGPRYIASQPWPFPSSLMLGYHAHADGGTPRARDGELEDVGWFSRAEIDAARRDRGVLRLPPPVSIARTLIDGWLAESDAARGG